MVDLVRLPKPDSEGAPKKPKPTPEPEPTQEPEFMPPELIKDSDSAKLRGVSQLNSDEKPSFWESSIQRLMHFKKWTKQLDPRIKLAVLTLFLVSMFGVSRLALAHWPIPSNPWPPANLADYPKPEPKPTTEPSKLTGLQVKFKVNKNPVIGVMIENSPDARPQAGLKDAGVVYEAIAEGGITRFLALFLDETPGYIGPIRSARPYYIRWLLSYDAAYAHVGGSPQALQDIKKLDVKDIDQFRNPGSYHRESHRYAPHNMYSSIDDLMKLAKSKGYKNSDFTGFARLEEEAEPHSKPNATTIDFAISSDLYNVQFRYDKKNNLYNRFMGGQKHTDEKSGKQITPKVVVALVTDRSTNGVYSVYRTIGKGTAYVFQNGRVAKVTWRKKGNSSKMELLDKNSKPFQLNPGQTWVTVLADTNQVSYKK